MKNLILTAAFVLCAAVFASCAREYTVAVAGGEGGTATAHLAGGVPADTLKAHPGDTVILTAVPEGHFVFREWIIAGGLEAVAAAEVLAGPTPGTSMFVMPEGDISFTAEFHDPRTDYYGTWKRPNGNQSSQFTLNEEGYVYAISGLFNTPIGYTVENLKWEEVKNTAGDHIADFPTGYKITGTIIDVLHEGITISIVRPDGSAGQSEEGEQAVEWLYLRTADNGALMMGEPKSVAHEAVYGPFVKEP